MIDSKKINNLVILTQKGEKQAFGQLYEIFAPEIYRFVFFRVKSRQDAEDLTQKIFIKAYKALIKSKGKFKNFRAWLYQISRNTVIDYYRTLKIHISWETKIIKSKVNVEKEALFKEEVEEAFQLLEKLKTKEKEILILYYIQGFQLKEIAKIMKKSPMAIRLTKHRALKKLKKFIVILEKQR